MGETGSRSMIFNHRGVQNFLARGDRQTAGSRTMRSTSEHVERKIEWNSPILTADLSSGTSMRPNLSPERMNLLNNQLLHPFDRVLILEAEVELCGANRFVRRVVPDLEVWVVQGFFASNSFRRIEVEHPRQEIDRERVGMGNKGGERNPRLDGKRPNILLGAGGTNTAKSVLRWRSQIV